MSERGVAAVLTENEAAKKKLTAIRNYWITFFGCHISFGRMIKVGAACTAVARRVRAIFSPFARVSVSLLLLLHHSAVFFLIPPCSGWQ